MALFLLQPGIQPLGKFDFLDTDLQNVLGGEVAVLMETDSRANTSSEKAAYDVLDGYLADEIDIGRPLATRVVARLADGYDSEILDATHGSVRIEPVKVFYLTDDGKRYYGTLFGEVVGDSAGLAVTGTQIGPHTATASGKVTLWDKPGVYAVSTDAVSDLLNPATGNLNDTPLPGTLLYREHNTAKLTTAENTMDKIGLFVEMTDSGSLVNTPGRLVGATQVLDRVVFQYLGATFNM